MSYLYRSGYILWTIRLWRRFLRIGKGKECHVSEMMPTWFKIYSANYSEPTRVSGNVSSVARHSSLNAYVIVRPFGRKLQKRPKNVEEIMPAWVPIYSANYSELTWVSGPCRMLLAITRKILMSSADLSGENYRKGQNTCKKRCPLEFQYTPRTTVNLHGFLGTCRVLQAIAR
jgi:hypothetical protein